MFDKIVETITPKTAPLHREGAAPLHVSLGLGALIGVLISLYAVSFAGIIFTGPLYDAFHIGLSHFLFGSFIVAVAACFGRPYLGALWQAQSVPVVILGLISAQVIEAGTQSVVATVLFLIAFVTCLSGGAMLAIGRMRVAKIAKAIPYPVVAGFLAATGVFLVLRAMEINLGAKPDWSNVFRQEGILRMLPPVLIALGMTVAQRWFSSFRVLVVTMVGICLLIYNGISLARVSLEDARAMGLLFDTVASEGAGRMAFALTGAQFGTVDFGIVSDQAPLIATAAMLAILGALLNYSAIEFSTGETCDLDEEMRKCGRANLMVGFFGGVIGYPSATLSILADSMTPKPDRLIAISSAVVVFVAFLTGPAIVSFLPRDLFAALLAYLGVELLRKWLVVERPRMPHSDYVVLWLILGTTLVAGFAWAIVLGIVLSSLRFTVAYAQLPAVHSAVPVGIRRSSIERSEPAAALLSAHGREALVCEVQGYIFFGTASKIQERVMREVDASGAVRTLVIDFKRVQGMDVSAIQMLGRLHNQLERRSIHLMMSGLSTGARKRIEIALQGAAVRFFPSVDDALMWLEEQLLERHAGDATSEMALAELSLQGLLDEISTIAEDVPLETRTLDPGDKVFDKGAPSDSFLVIDEGRLFATVSGDTSGEERVATFLKGAAVGEIGFVTGSARTASVFAETASRVRIVTHADLEKLRASNPHLALALNEHLSRLMARRLTRTTALLFAID